jgi:hypothetical protein
VDGARRDIIPAPAARIAAVLPWAVFLLLVAASWNRWMEPFVDSGRELMVPRRLAQGESLYSGIQFFHGPLAPWAGALIERAAERSIAARTVFAGLLAAAALESLRRLCRRWMPGIEGALAASAAVVAAFFLRPGGWMFPFSFDTAIAIAAILGALAALAAKPAPWRDAAAAACLLAALLARPELGVAGIAAAALDARTFRRIAVVAGAPLALAAAGYAAVSWGIPFETLIQDGWLAILRPPRAFQNVYRAYAGLDRLGLRALELTLCGVVALLAAGYLAGAAAAARSARRASAASARWVEAGAVLLLAALAWPFHFPPERWAPTLELVPPFVRLVPPLVFAAAAVRAAGRLRRRPSLEWAPEVSDGALLIAVLFAARLALAAGYAGPYNAFFLPLPLAVCASAAGVAARRLSAAAGESLARLSAAALGVFILLRGASLAAGYRGAGWEALETSAGRVVLPSVEASTSRLVLADLARRLPTREATLLGMPEAGFFEYVTGAKNPLPLEQFWPGHLDARGESRIAELLALHPPDALLLVNALAVGEGARAFGQDYSIALGAFVDARFRPAATYGPDPRPGARIGDPAFFVQVRVPVKGEDGKR